jgi:uncharacterized membrane protein
MPAQDTARVEAFSDGVFAIAITLLILEIKVPHLPAANADLFGALLGLWPSFLAFVASFAAILIMWMNHRGLCTVLHHVETPFLFANGFLLLLVTFVPFPTALLAAYLNTPGANAAAAFYCGTYVLIGLAYNLLWYSATRGRRLIKPEVTSQHLTKIRQAYLLGLFVYSAAVLLSFANALAGLFVCSALWGFWASLDYRPKG